MGVGHAACVDVGGAVRRAAKVDTTQAPTVRDLRATGVRVADIHRLGGGAPDILVYVPALNLWTPIELKSADGTLTDHEVQWWRKMGCEPIIARNSREALAAAGVIEEGQHGA